MALINCPECRKQISDQVRKCPECGFNQFNSGSWLGTITAFFALFIGLTVILTNWMEISSGPIIAFIISLIGAIYGHNKRATPY